MTDVILLTIQIISDLVSNWMGNPSSGGPKTLIARRTTEHLLINAPFADRVTATFRPTGVDGDAAAQVTTECRSNQVGWYGARELHEGVGELVVHGVGCCWWARGAKDVGDEVRLRV
jgi:hypothetical protein